MKAYWANLSERERWMLSVAVAFSLIVFIYVLIYSPLMHAIHNKKKQLIEKKETLLWMKQAYQQHHAVNKLESLHSGQLLSVMGAQLKTTSFHTFSYQLQQTSIGEIQLSFDKVPYNAFMTWIWSLKKRYAFQIKQLNVEPTEDSGSVKLSIILTVPD